ncbi:MAG: GNAT family N-acetyltransferase [Candidatus Altiarchaeota archaeon]|nr:GNAT family N-acetyltransferase [Candidatus Altiarchaeota archaeon]
MIVREAEMGEIPEIRELIKEMLDELGVGQDQLEFEMNVRYGFSPIRRNMSVSEEFFLLAEEKNSVIGLALFKPLKSGIVSLNKIYVRKSNRKKGVGRMLVEFIENIAKEQGKHKLVILAQADNKDALKFYESVGFEQEGQLKKHYWGFDYVSLGKQLGSVDKQSEPVDKQPEPEKKSE